MKSIKPGRGPSGMGAFMGIIAAIFGVFWTVLAMSMGAFIMVPFGVIFIVVAVVNTVYNYKNATGENRYSSFDIVDETEEKDPLNERFGTDKGKMTGTATASGKNFCPYCGERVGEEHKFCSNCGNKLE